MWNISIRIWANESGHYRWRSWRNINSFKYQKTRWRDWNHSIYKRQICFLLSMCYSIRNKQYNTFLWRYCNEKPWGLCKEKHWNQSWNRSNSSRQGQKGNHLCQRQCRKENEIRQAGSGNRRKSFRSSNERSWSWRSIQDKNPWWWKRGQGIC